MTDTAKTIVKESYEIGYNAGITLASREALNEASRLRSIGMTSEAACVLDLAELLQQLKTVE